MQTKPSLPSIYALSACFNTNFHPACPPLKQCIYDNISEHVLMGFSSQPKIKLQRSYERVINTYFILLNYMVTRQKIMRHNSFRDFIKFSVTLGNCIKRAYRKLYTTRIHRAAAVKQKGKRALQTRGKKKKYILNTKYFYFPLPAPTSIISHVTLPKFPTTWRCTIILLHCT